VTNRPLAGTRKRGATPEEDAALEKELLADEKEVSEHIMLVDLGRNDVGKVAQPGSVTVERLMNIERYSHVMHISSSVTGAHSSKGHTPGLTSISANNKADISLFWDHFLSAESLQRQCRSSLKSARTISRISLGCTSSSRSAEHYLRAPKVREMQITDELQIIQRGPYGGGCGHILFSVIEWEGELDHKCQLPVLFVC
jgi:anthranilate synthase component 1